MALAHANQRRRLLKGRAHTHEPGRYKWQAGPHATCAASSKETAPEGTYSYRRGRSYSHGSARGFPAYGRALQVSCKGFSSSCH